MTRGLGKHSEALVTLVAKGCMNELLGSTTLLRHRSSSVAVELGQGKKRQHDKV